MVVTMMVLLLCSCLQLGSQPVSHTLMFGLTMNFYCGQWEEFHTHNMTTSLAGLIGVTEGKCHFFYMFFLSPVQMLVYLVILVNGYVITFVG